MSGNTFAVQATAVRLRVAALVALCALGALQFAPPAEAEQGGHGQQGGRGQHYDTRYNHNQYYPARGAVVGRVPREAVVVNHASGRYWYHGGVWYGARGPRWWVVAPPFGVFVPLLPPFYTTVWFGGIPYYYANDTYYLWRERERVYEVVPEPRDQQATVLPPEAQELYIYPKSGQDAAQQAQDRYECHRWAGDQTGFDPTRPAGGVAPEQAAGKRGEYQRAMTACLEARGYSVK
jgi:hypothetical protein